MQLQHQEIEEETSLGASIQHTDGRSTEAAPAKGETLRVTPEEVALAAAALEAKRENDSARRQATLPLGEAIQHLGLNATPEELAPEVVALRTAIKLAAFQKQMRRGTWLAAAVLLSVLVGLIMLVLSPFIRRAQRTLHPMAVLPIQKLSSISDNTPVHIDSDTLAALAIGNVTAENVSVDTRTEDSGGAQSATMFNNEWTLLKSDGTIQVQGWATAEFALNISNDATGAIFSSRPGWLPANNLVPIRVPVYRLYKQEIARYFPDGKSGAGAANSVLMAMDVADIGTAAKDFIEQDIPSADVNFQTSHSYSKGPFSYISVSVKNKAVMLEGNATTPRLKALAGDVASKTLQRLHIPYPISNELKIAPTNDE